MKTYFKIERITLQEYKKLGGSIDNYSETITEVIDQKTVLVYTNQEHLDLEINIVDLNSSEASK